MDSKFATTKMVFEIEATTQMGPESAIAMIETALRFPAVQSVKCVKAETNFRLHQEPGEGFVDFPV